MTTSDALHAVILAAKERPKSKALQYAATYASAALFMSGEMLRVQLIYVLSNTMHWSGDRAKAAKGVLRNASKKEKDGEKKDG